jgi:hypothetical protein
VLGLPVQFASNCVGEEAKSAAANLKAGEVFVRIYVFMQKKRMVMLLSKRLISWRYLCE